MYFQSVKMLSIYEKTAIRAILSVKWSYTLIYAEHFTYVEKCAFCILADCPLESKTKVKKKVNNNYAWLNQKLIFIDVRWYQMMNKQCK